MTSIGGVEGYIVDVLLVQTCNPVWSSQKSTTGLGRSNRYPKVLENYHEHPIIIGLIIKIVLDCAGN